jgi:lipopolysaccharide export system protein LptA
MRMGREFYLPRKPGVVTIKAKELEFDYRTRELTYRGEVIVTQGELTLRADVLRVTLDVYASSTRVAHAAGGGTLARSTTVCGARTYRLRVKELAGRGSFRLSLSKP